MDAPSVRNGRDVSTGMEAWFTSFSRTLKVNRFSVSVHTNTCHNFYLVVENLHPCDLVWGT